MTIKVVSAKQLAQGQAANKERAADQTLGAPILRQGLAGKKIGIQRNRQQSYLAAQGAKEKL